MSAPANPPPNAPRDATVNAPPTAPVEPSSLPRALAIMGSGETAPTMARVHRRLIGRLGTDRVAAALLDTPYGFQENADEITERALEYFRENVGAAMQLALFRSADEDPLLRSTAVARARGARYLFAGPGSPSYALRQWQGSEIPAVIADKLANGGIVTFASAAALTLGAWTIPVYEIYKVGHAPTWLSGLDVLGPLGLHVAVIPHYDNAEGGSHDTRFCYMGERRLSVLEAALPDDHAILGVDSHTALVLDFGEGSASVLGLGAVTVRVRGRSEIFETGSSVPIARLVEAAERLRKAGAGIGAGAAAAVPGPVPHVARSAPVSSPLLDEAHALELRFEESVAAGEGDEAIRAVLALENTLVSWSRDTAGTDEVDRARGILQALIVRLGERGVFGGAGTEDRLAPLAELLIDLRDRARTARDYRQADWIRDALLDAGIELHDGPEGTTWQAHPRG